MIFSNNFNYAFREITIHFIDILQPKKKQVNASRYVVPDVSPVRASNDLIVNLDLEPLFRGY